VTEGLTRDRIIEVLRELPADATIDDAMEKLVFVAQIERGIAELDTVGLSLGATSRTRANARFGRSIVFAVFLLTTLLPRLVTFSPLPHDFSWKGVDSANQYTS
jgi:hypothetical protein